MEIKFVQTDELAKLPKRNNDNGAEGDVGYDIFSIKEVSIPARQSAVVPVGMKVGKITPGYWFRVEARSGLGFKHSIFPHFGVIDQPYRGDLGIKLYNNSDTDQVIKVGQACAQIIVYKMIDADMGWMNAEEVEATARGEAGFGSSDKKA